MFDRSLNNVFVTIAIYASQGVAIQKWFNALRILEEPKQQDDNKRLWYQQHQHQQQQEELQQQEQQHKQPQQQGCTSYTLDMGVLSYILIRIRMLTSWLWTWGKRV